jgi:lysozyme
VDRNKLLEEITRDEGCVNEVYEDHLGYATFGVGHLIKKTDPEFGEDVGIAVSEERVQECLSSDIDTVCKELDKNMEWWKDLSDNRRRILANMCFNLGYTRLSKFKKFIAALQEQNWETAAVEMMDSRWATQVGARATRLRDRMLED